MANTMPSRYPSRGTTNIETLHHIIDEGLFCTVAFIRGSVPFQIPTGFVRVDDSIYIHASAKSKFLEDIIGQEVSFSITHLDALVLAPTAFDHSFNYRSVIGFSKAVEITEPMEKLKFFNLFTDRYIPGRIKDVGEPSEEHIKATKIVRLSLYNAAAKVRSGDVNVKMEEDEVWCGIIPIEKKYGLPQPDAQIKGRLLPEYIKKLIDGFGEH